MIIGITGGIGSGKSTIARELAQRGFAVYDCDREAKRIITEKAEVRRAIIDLLGEEAFLESVYNTSYVAQRVFAEPKLLDALNAIVHPAVREDILAKNEVNRALAAKKPVLFIESAILFEAGLDTLCDKVFLIDAPEEIRIARTITRDYAGEATEENINKVRTRIKRQLSAVSIPQSNKNTTVLMNDGTCSISALADKIIAFL